MLEYNRLHATLKLLEYKAVEDPPALPPFWANGGRNLEASCVNFDFFRAHDVCVCVVGGWGGGDKQQNNLQTYFTEFSLPD
jgi:hypothetical protein